MTVPVLTPSLLKYQKPRLAYNGLGVPDSGCAALSSGCLAGVDNHLDVTALMLKGMKSRCQNLSLVLTSWVMGLEVAATLTFFAADDVMKMLLYAREVGCCASIFYLVSAVEYIILSVSFLYFHS